MSAISPIVIKINRDFNQSEGLYKKDVTNQIRVFLIFGRFQAKDDIFVTGTFLMIRNYFIVTFSKENGFFSQITLIHFSQKM